MVTYFVVLAFQRDKKGRLYAEEPKEARDESRAKRMVEALASTHVGVVAFSRSGDPDLGDWDEAVIIERRGEVPEELLDAVAA